jgi:hypothetical protein
LPTLPAPTPLVVPVVLAPGGTIIGLVGPVVVGEGTAFGEMVLPGATAFGETVPPGVTAFGLLFGITVRLEFTVAPLLGTTVVLGPEVSGATVVLGPDVSGATVALGPVKKLGLALVGFCALAAPLGAMVVLVVAARCCCCWARQAGRWVAVCIMQLVPGGKAVFCALAAVAALAAPTTMAPMRAARRIE